MRILCEADADQVRERILPLDNVQCDDWPEGDRVSDRHTDKEGNRYIHQVLHTQVQQISYETNSDDGKAN